VSFPENTPPPAPEPDFLGFPADAAAPPPVAEAPAEMARARRLFRRFERPTPSPGRTAAVHLGLFVITLITTTLAGVQLTRGAVDFLPIEVFSLRGAALWAALRPGLWFALPFLGVLTVHEFGHYFTARYNRVRASLPYYIPFPMGLGTFGAVIRIRERIFSRREFFDIGLAGPLAGFLVAVPLLIYGFTHLPPLNLFPVSAPSEFTLARPLLYQWLEHLFADPALLPHPNELLHYPVLLAGELSLFFTALNLLPMGQLDGGHILYGLLGPRRFNRLVPVLFVGFIFYAGLGIFTLHSDWQTWAYGGPIYAGYLALIFWRVLPRPHQGLLLAAGIWAAQVACTLLWPGVLGNPGWLVFGLLLGRFTGIYHPPAPDERGLSRGRQLLGWVMVAIFVLCFTPSPFG
jgi:membrane-associated protease RseP (regulator of RpoE activity)